MMSLTPNISEYSNRRKQQFAERSCTSVANFGQYNSDNALSFLKQIVLVIHINLTFLYSEGICSSCRKSCYSLSWNNGKPWGSWDLPSSLFCTDLYIYCSALVSIMRVHHCWQFPYST